MEVFHRNASSAALHPLLVVGERDIILDKPRYGAFHATDLELILRSQNIDSLFRVFFLSDGTLPTTPGGLSADEVQ